MLSDRREHLKELGLVCPQDAFLPYHRAEPGDHCPQGEGWSPAGHQVMFAAADKGPYRPGLGVNPPAHLQGSF